jgi:hypothetical protein
MKFWVQLEERSGYSFSRRNLLAGACSVAAILSITTLISGFYSSPLTHIGVQQCR